MRIESQGSGTPELLQAIIEGIPIRVFWKDRQSRYLGCNSLFARDAGVDAPCDVVNRTDHDLAWRAQAELYRADDRTVMESGVPKIFFEERQTSPSGALLWLRTSKVPLRDRAGAVIGVLGIYEDITARKETETRLRDTETRYRALVEQSPIATHVLAPDGRTRSVNQAWRQLWGITPEAALDYSLLDDPQLAAIGLLPQLRLAFAGETVVIPDFEYDRPPAADRPGARLWLRTRLYPVLEADGTIGEVVALHEDLTTFKQSEAALRESEQRFRRLFESSPDPCWIIDSTNRFSLCNRAAAEGFGYDRVAEVIARHPSELSPERQPDGALSKARADEMIGLAHARGVHRFEWMHRRRDGTEFPMEVTLAEIVTAGERQLYCIGRDISERKRFEQSLVETRLRHEEAQRLAHLGHWHVDHPTNTFTCSEEILRIFGLAGTALDNTPATIGRCIHPDDRGAVEAAFYKSLHERTSYDLEHRVVTPDRVVRWVHARAETTYAPNGTPLRTSGTALDITARHAAEVSLRAANAFLEGIISGAAEGISVCFAVAEPPYVQFSVWNRRMTEMTGYTLEEINRLGWYQTMYVDPDVRTRAISRMDRMRIGDDLVNEEWQVTTKAGEKRTLSISTSTLTLSDGTPAVIGLMHDVTARIQSEEALHRSEQRYRGIFDESVAPTFVFDAHERFVDANQAGIELLGYSRDELLRLDASDVEIEPANAAAHRARLQAGERLVNVQHRLRRKDGRTLVVLSNSRPLTDGAGALVGIHTTLFDVTELHEAQDARARLQAQLNDMQRLEAIGRLAGGVAHDFNNMLTVILGGAEAGLADLSPDHPVHACLKEIQDAAHRSAELTRQLLAFASRQTTVPVVMDLNGKIAGALRMLGRIIGENVRLEWRPGDGVGSIRVDPSQIDQLLTNLCVNARDAITGLGTVRIGTARLTLGADELARRPAAMPGDYAVITFSDDGQGIPGEVLDHIFEPFFTTKGVGHGTGLGLATVYGIVRQNGGHIEVASTPGAGTTFRVFLPSHRDAEVSDAADRGASHAGGARKTVLLVEDEPDVMRMTLRLLERLGCRVIAAGSAEAAFQAVERHGAEIDMLLTDVIMPDMNGRDLSRRIRARLPGLATVFVSGYAPDDMALDRDLAEGARFLAKPFTMDQLSAALDEVLPRDSRLS